MPFSDDFIQEVAERNPIEEVIGEKIVSIEDVLSMYPALTCTPEGDRLLGNGNPVPEELVQGGNREEKVRMYKSSGNFTGIYGWDERKQKYVPVRMFFV